MIDEVFEEEFTLGFSVQPNKMEIKKAVAIFKNMVLISSIK